MSKKTEVTCDGCKMAIEARDGESTYYLTIYKSVILSQKPGLISDLVLHIPKDTGMDEYECHFHDTRCLDKWLLNK